MEVVSIMRLTLKHFIVAFRSRPSPRRTWHNVVQEPVAKSNQTFNIECVSERKIIEIDGALLF